MFAGRQHFLEKVSLILFRLMENKQIIIEGGRVKLSVKQIYYGYYGINRHYAILNIESDSLEDSWVGVKYWGSKEMGQIERTVFCILEKPSKVLFT